MKANFKTFPLRVSEDFLDAVEKARHKSESKHDFITTAVLNEIKRRKKGYDLLDERGEK